MRILLGLLVAGACGGSEIADVPDALPTEPDLFIYSCTEWACIDHDQEQEDPAYAPYCYWRCVEYMGRTVAMSVTFEAGIDGCYVAEVVAVPTQCD